MKPYIVKLNKNKTIKPKTYTFYYAIKSKNKLLIIVIIQDTYNFSANRGLKKACAWKKKHFYNLNNKNEE